MNYRDIKLNIRRGLVKYHDQQRSGRRKIVFKMFSLVVYWFDIYLKSLGLQINRLELIPFDGPTELFRDINDDNLKREFKTYRKKIHIQSRFQRINMYEEEAIFLSVKAKQRINMSRVAYQRFVRTINQIPTLRKADIKLHSWYKINCFYERLNIFFPIRHNRMGVYIEPLEKIQFVLKKIFQQLGGQIEESTFNIHLCGDGMCLTRTRVTIINFAFKVMNEPGKESNDKLYRLGKLN